MTPALIRSQGWPQSAQPSPLQHVQLIVIMSTLAKLGFHDWSGDTNVYDWLLLNFNSNNCGPEVVTYGLVTDLKDLLHLKRSKHEEVPRNKLSRQQLCHLLIYLVTRISSENVTKNGCLLLKLCHSVAGCGVIGPCTQGWGVGLKLE